MHTFITRIHINTHNLLKCKHTVGINQMLIVGRSDFQLSMHIFITLNAFYGDSHNLNNLFLAIMASESYIRFDQ